MFTLAAFAVSLSQLRLVTAARADDASGPMAVAQQTVNQAVAVLADKQTPLAQRQDHLRQIVSASFDFTEMAKSAMGSNWKKITPDQQQEFTTTFVAFIEDAYLSRLNEYQGQQVVFKRATTDGPEYAQVATEITQTRGDPIAMNFQLFNKNGAWKIYDVTVDNLSIIANYRNQFARVMNNQGYQKLIDDLKSKQASLAASLGNH
jgi:phospholipid transport system substrate-binding protein